MKKIYTIVFITCSMLLSGLSLKAQVQNLCGNDTVILHLNNYQYGAIQWEVSEDSVGWKIIDGAIDTVYKFYPDGNKYYRAGITLALCPIIYSEIFKVSMPVKANAGMDIRTSIPNTMLSANKPKGCNGQWKIINGTGGTLTDSTNNLSKFTGQMGQTYTLVWSLTNICGTTTDTVNVALIQNVYRNNIVYVDTTDIILSDSTQRAQGNYTIKFSSPVPTVTDSTVLIFLTKDMLLLKVQTVTTNADTVEMTTIQGSLQDFMVSGVIDFSPFNYKQSTLKSGVENNLPTRQDLANNSFANGQIIYYKQASSNSPITTKTKSLKDGGSDNTLALTINPIEIYSDDNITLNVSGNINFTPNLISFVNVQWMQLDTMIIKLDNAVLDYTIVPELIITGSSNVVNFKKEWPLYQQDVLVMAGDVPVWISADISVKALFSVDITGTVDAKLTYNYKREYNAGLYYGQHDKKFTTFYNATTPIKTITPSITGQATLDSKLQLGPSFSLKLYDALTGDVDFYALDANINACIDNQLDWNASIGLSSELVLSGTGEILGWEFWNDSYTIPFQGFTDEFPSRISKESGDMQTGTAGQTLTNPIKVKVQSDWYIPVPLANVYFEPLNGSVLNTKVVTDINGNAQTNWTLDNTAGTQYLNAYIEDCNSNVINSKISFTAYTDAGAKGCETSTLDITLDVNTTNNTIKPIATRGALPYQYSTDGNTYQSTIPELALTDATNYIFYVKDANGCVKQKSFKNSPAPCANAHITATISIDSRQRTITVTPKGGTAPYQYAYITSTTFTTDSTYTFTNSGAYTVYVKDANTCQATTSITIQALKDSIATGIVFNPNLTYGIVTDIEGNTYKTIVIGTQTWMAENLRTTKYNDGTTIPNIIDSAAWINDTLGAFCTYNNTTNIDTINTYGRLYNWYSVNTGKLCPSGWHVPDTTGWNILQNYLIANGYNYDTADITNNNIAKSMASTKGWNYQGWNPSINTVAIGNNPSINNKSGFTALPGGYRFSDGTFYDLGYLGCWWSSTQTSTNNADSKCMYADFSDLETNGGINVTGLSVRCVKDSKIAPGYGEN